MHQEVSRHPLLCLFHALEVYPDIYPLELPRHPLTAELVQAGTLESRELAPRPQNR